MTPVQPTLAGRTVLITGAARGMGAELARAVVARGGQVALLGLEADLLTALADELGQSAAAWEADVTDGEALDAAVASAAQHFGGLDVAVANAGITAFAPVAALDPATFEKVIAVNLTGVWRTLRAAQPFVQARPGGYLLSVCSMAAFLQSPLQAHYTASKAGVHALTESLRLELKGTDTRVGGAYLTFVSTDMMTRTVADAAGHALWGGNTGGLNAIISPDQAVQALARGIERRARRIVVPRRLTPVTLAPGLVQPFFSTQFTAGRVQAAIRAATPAGWHAPGRDGPPAPT